jgi:hypothetical protein
VDVDVDVDVDVVLDVVVVVVVCLYERSVRVVQAIVSVRYRPGTWVTV